MPWSCGRTAVPLAALLLLLAVFRPLHQSSDFSLISAVLLALALRCRQSSASAAHPRAT
ncbi:hypothetical protein [Methanoculleus taiwanensis]|uniref:hypothetical protein n=1 Tax=Methanoculleus taiwanensis TaxID=1550565 RepID=UPI0013E8C0C4|nr:hypothetical protein [Methanoculleus taiwanensis]